MRARLSENFNRYNTFTNETFVLRKFIIETHEILFVKP